MNKPEKIKLRKGRKIMMTDKEFSEIKKRFRPDRNNITSVTGCFVSSSKEILSRFKIPVGVLADEQKEWLMKLLKKAVTGAYGRNLQSIEFSNEQVESGEEHKLLMDLRESGLENEELLTVFYEKIISSFTIEDSYLILLAYDPYDVPSFSKNDEDIEDSTEMFRYFVCSVCPVKITKSALGFSLADNTFKNIGAESSVCQPKIGFMFPSFEDRRTNIYNAVFYTGSTKENYPEVLETLFGATAQMPAEEQKETFCNLVAEPAGEGRSLEFVQSVQNMISDMMTEHKESKDPEPLLLDKNDVKRVLRTCGADEKEMEGFDERFESGFGESAEISPQNIVNPKQFEIKNSYLSLKVDPQYSFMVETKVLDGTKYVMVRADEGVQLNGISIHFDGEEPSIMSRLSKEIEDTAATTKSSEENN